MSLIGHSYFDERGRQFNVSGDLHFGIGCVAVLALIGGLVGTVAALIRTGPGSAAGAAIMAISGALGLGLVFLAGRSEMRRMERHLQMALQLGKSAEEHAAAKELAAASDLYRQAIKLHPLPELHLGLARVLAGLGDSKGALRHQQGALELASALLGESGPAAHYLDLASVYVVLGRGDDAALTRDRLAQKIEAYQKYTAELRHEHRLQPEKWPSIEKDRQSYELAMESVLAEIDALISQSHSVID